jgi:hypothetical protein
MFYGFILRVSVKFSKKIFRKDNRRGRVARAGLTRLHYIPHAPKKSLKIGILILQVFLHF